MEIPVIYRQSYPYETYLQDLEGYIQNKKEVFILCDHPPVLTAGRNQSPDDPVYRAAGSGQHFPPADDVSIHTISRGGQLTYHEPGQNVFYPIVNLRHHDFLLGDFLKALQAAALHTAALLTGGSYSFHLERGKPGVYVSGTNPAPKIGSIGVSVSQKMTAHGLALNTFNSLDLAGRVIACGEAFRPVTSVSKLNPRAGALADQYARPLGLTESGAHQAGGLILLYYFLRQLDSLFLAGWGPIVELDELQPLNQALNTVD